MAVVDPFERGKMLADGFDRGYYGFILLRVSLRHISDIKDRRHFPQRRRDAKKNGSKEAMYRFYDSGNGFPQRRGDAKKGNIDLGGDGL
jgi:hypothetical protein